MTGLKIAMVWLANWALFKRRISSSVLPENMEPQITSMQPDFLKLSENISLLLQSSANLEKFCFMRKTGLQILSEIREALDVISGKMAEVELQLAELEGFMDVEEPAAEELAEESPVAEEPVAAQPVVETPAVEEPVAEVPVFEEPAVEPPVVDQPVVDQPVVEEPIDVVLDDISDSDILAGLSEPEPLSSPLLDPPAPAVSSPVSIPVAESVKPKQAVIDVMADKCAWRTDIPGSPVRNIISGISLNDRILFINSLFKGDAQAFQATIALFNTYETLDQAEEFIRSNYPGWNLDSEIVYRFMMAVRRKLGR